MSRYNATVWDSEKAISIDSFLASPVAQEEKQPWGKISGLTREFDSYHYASIGSIMNEKIK